MRTAALLGCFILTSFLLVGAEETAPNPSRSVPLSESSRKSAIESRRPPEEVIQNLELFQNLPLLKEIELFEQMPPKDGGKKKCAGGSPDCSTGRVPTETKKGEEVAE